MRPRRASGPAWGTLADMGRALHWVGGLMLCLAAAGCSGAGSADEADTIGDESAALTGGGFAEGSTVITTSRLRFRDAPSTSAGVIEILPFHAQLTVVDTDVQNSFVHVQKDDGTEGYVHGSYIRSDGGGTSSTDNGGDSSAFPTSHVFRARGTGYYPANNAMEGGFSDRRGVRLRTLQQYLNGSADYVSVAMDPHAFNYGQKLRIKELEQKYGRQIEFRVVDTGGAFMGRGTSRIDICTANSSASVDPTINGMLTIAAVN